MGASNADAAARRATRRRRLRETAAVIALLLAGLVVLAAAGDAELAIGIGVGLCGLAGVGAMSFVFYEVGLSEDRARARGWRGPYDRAEPPTAPPRRVWWSRRR
jgi:hypothetical protein